MIILLLSTKRRASNSPEKDNRRQKTRNKTYGSPSVSFFCFECDGYLQRPSTWMEGQQLLSLSASCGRRNSTIRLVDSKFVRIEPHSRRIEETMTVQVKGRPGMIVQQDHVVKWLQKDRMGELCLRIRANLDRWWGAVVQLRQHVSHQRTFFYLEQLILKHDAAVCAIKINR